MPTSKLKNPRALYCQVERDTMRKLDAASFLENRSKADIVREALDFFFLQRQRKEEKLKQAGKA